jgi:hypothetical protein
MLCSIINEGTAPRHALGGLQPASKPVAPSTSGIIPEIESRGRSSRKVLAKLAVVDRERPPGRDASSAHFGSPLATAPANSRCVALMAVTGRARSHPCRADGCYRSRKIRFVALIALTDSARSAPCRAASPGPFRWRACRVASCPSPAPRPISLARFSNTARGERACSPCARLRR